MKHFLCTMFAAVAGFLLGLGERINDALFRHMARAGMLATLGEVPNDAAFDAARVTLPGQSEAVRQRLYDYQLYPLLGVGQMSFFQNPIGQGITTSLGGVVGSPKTYGDTNMNIGGQLPSGMAYLVQSIEVQYFAGSSAAANTYLPALISRFAAANAAAVTAAVDDINTFYQSGFLEFNILQKNYVRETPLITFPPRNTLSFNSAIASTSATAAEVATVFARADGATYEIPGGILLAAGVNFAVTLNWPAAVITPSTFNARVGVILDGWVKRSSQ
jgi:hypothetical protein